MRTRIFWIKCLLITLVLNAWGSHLLLAQSKEELAKKYIRQLKSKGIIRSDLSNAEIETILRDPGASRYIVEYTGRAIDKAQVKELVAELRASGHLDRRLTEAEIKVVSENPDKAIKIVEITEYAQRRAKEEYSKNPNVCQDSYRHILWSYMLTKEFGPVFAEELTTAHEIGSGNSPAETRKDLRNNAVGRRIAARGMSEDDILWVLQERQETTPLIDR
jgi:hypothetical protein